MQTYNSKTLKIATTLVAFVAVYIASDYLASDHKWFGLRKNVSDSLPFKWFISFKLDAIRRNDYVAFYHEQHGVILAKKMTGIPGDSIAVRDDHVFVNHQDCGGILKQSPSGRTLTPIRENIIPEGFVFVSGTHKDSFDSRYAEFGLMRIEDLQEVLWPIF